MKNKIAKILMVAISIGLLIGCVSETYKEPISKECVSPNLTANKTVADIWAIAINPTVPVGSVSPATPIYTNTIPTVDDIIEGYVISSDEGGNFYQSMYFQPLDKSKGFNFSVDIKNAYLEDFQPGKKVYLKLNGLAFANPTQYAAGLVFGSKPTSIFNVDRLKGYESFLIPSCDIVSEDLLVNSGLTIAQAKSDIYVNTLVELKNVQFKTDCSTYSKKDFDTTLKLTDASGATFDVRTSKFANFAGNFVPTGSGTIRGVLAKYNTGYQIILRTERDVKFNEPRFGQPATPPKIGINSNIFNGTLNENFSGYSNSTSVNLPKYINQVDIGTKYWDLTSFGTGSNINSYIQTSAFNNGCTKNYFIVPINFTTATGLSFNTLDGYNNGQPLKVYYSKNYVPGTNMNQANLIDISSKFKFADGRPETASKYASDFKASGIFSIPDDLTGNGYIIFEYDGTNGVTTTIQLDDIVIN
jgi:Family of unknown function (DUF5689)